MKRAHKRITSSEQDPFTNRQLKRHESGGSSFGLTSSMKKINHDSSAIDLDAGQIRETIDYKPILTVGLMRGPNFPFHTIDELPNNIKAETWRNIPVDIVESMQHIIETF